MFNKSLALLHLETENVSLHLVFLFRPCRHIHCGMFRANVDCKMKCGVNPIVQRIVRDFKRL